MKKRSRYHKSQKKFQKQNNQNYAYSKPSGKLETLTAVELTNEGKGLSKNEEGFISFVQGLLPGETGVVEILKSKSSFRVGVLKELLETSKERQIPRCLYLKNPDIQQRCGGCQLQHFDEREQSAQKIQWFFEALKRIGKMSGNKLEKLRSHFSVVSLPTWNYRRRIRLHFNGTDLGFYAQNSRSIVPIQSCWIAAPQLNECLSDLRIRLDSLKGDLKNLNSGNDVYLEIELTLGYRNSVGIHLCQINCDQKQEKEIRDFLHKKLDIQHDMKIAVSHPLTPKFRIAKDSFIQPHLFATEAYVYEIRDRLVQFSDKYPKGPWVVWDLFCGSGALTSIVPETFPNQDMEVMGVEGIPAACESARAHLKSEKISILEKDVGHFLDDKIKELQSQKALSESRKGDFEKAHIVILDPPRSGLGLSSVMKLIEVCHRKSFLFYLSCDAATFTRDVRIFLEGGFELRYATLFDSFGQTTHYEVLGVLERVKVS